MPAAPCKRWAKRWGEIRATFASGRALAARAARLLPGRAGAGTTLPKALAEEDRLTPATPVWSELPEALLARLGSSLAGPADGDVAGRRRPGDRLASGSEGEAVRLFLAQLTSPITLILLAATIVAASIGEVTEALMIGIIVLVSAVLGFVQEHGAARAVARLLASVEVRARVVRSGVEREVPFDEVVVGDLLILSCGDLVPADARVVEARDLSVDESSLTGESFPAEKRVGLLPATAPLAARSNVVHCGTHVVAGSARAVVYAVGRATEVGHVAERLRSRAPETDFERGVRRFGNLLVD